MLHNERSFRNYFIASFLVFVLLSLPIWVVAGEGEQGLSYAALGAGKVDIQETRLDGVLNRAHRFLDQGNYHKAMKYGLVVLENLDKAENRDSTKAAADDLISRVFFNTGNYQKTIEYQNQALTYYRISLNKRRVCNALNLIGLSYTHNGEHTGSLKYFIEALEIAVTNKLRKEGAILNNLGIVYIRKDTYDKAYDFYQKALQFNIEIDNKVGICENYNNLGDLYVRIGESEKAEEVLKKAKFLSDSLHDKIRIIDNTLYWAKFYELKGETDASMVSYKKYLELSDQLNENRGTLTVNAILNDFVLDQKEHELELKNQEILLLEKQKRLDMYRNYGLSALLLLVGIVFYLFYTKQKTTRQKDKEIFETRENLIQVKLDNTELEKNNLQNELEYKNQELVNFALYISQKNTMLKELSDLLKKMKRAHSEELMNEVKEQLNQLHSNIKIKDDIEQFQAKVEHVNQDFFYRLKQKFPNLTENDKRMCAHLRLKLSSKEIASLHNITVRSVEVSRHRLRKKLSLTSEENLVEYVQKL